MSDTKRIAPMTNLRTRQCRICGRGLLDWQSHAGAVDCIAAYRDEVSELRSLLPRGKEVCRAPIARDVEIRLWIDGEPDHDALERLITYVRFMQQAWAPDTVELNNVDTAEAPEASSEEGRSQP